MGIFWGSLNIERRKKMVKGQSFSGYFSYQGMCLSGVPQRQQDKPELCASIFAWL